MLRIKPPDYGLHDGPSHEVRLASYPEPFAIDTECSRLPLIQPERQRRVSLYLLLGGRSASQSRYEFYTKVAGTAIPWANENRNLSTMKKQVFANGLTCFALAY
jgi:hypothetical protein